MSFKFDMYLDDASAPHFAALATHMSSLAIPERGDGFICGQICGIDYARHQNSYHYLASFSLAASAVPAGHYRSVIIAAAGYEPASGEAPRCAINHYGSFSGDYAFHDWWEGQGRAPLDNVQVTGAHRASLLAVAKGEADIAAIDELSFHLAAHAFPEIAEVLNIIDYTPARPGLPFLCAAPYGAQKDAIRDHLLAFTKTDAFTALSELLGLSQMDVIDDDAFAALATIADRVDAKRLQDVSQQAP